MPLVNYILLIIAYLFGSIPTSVWVGKIFYKIDIREHGSGNAGANNTFRVMGARAGLPVLLIDVLKGFGAVQLILFNSHFQPGNSHYDIYMLALGIMAVIGHILPIFARFDGGKGVATILGITLAYQPIPGLTALLIFVIVVFIFKYVSLGSILAAISFPVLLFFVFQIQSIPFQIYSVVVALLIIITHAKNIGRLLHGNESVIQLNGGSLIK